MPFSSASNRISLTEFPTKESRENCNRKERAFPKEKESTKRKAKIFTPNSNSIKSGPYPAGIRNKKLGCSLPERQRTGFGGGTRNRRQRRDREFPIPWRADASQEVPNCRRRGAPAAPLPRPGRYGCRLRRRKGELSI
ncbi:hypothetical protein BHM03_00051424 [Ensete ventricosum]|nr:hypothetical protein BHM03_00051424 [Ensete ventricosum]